MYTFEDMTTERDVHVVKNEDGTSTEVWNTAFALLDENENPIIQIYDFDNRRFIDGSFVLDTDTMEAKKEGGRKSVKVEADLDQGIWFAA